MRLVSFTAPTCKHAMSDLRSALGDEAVILSTQTLEDGQVCVTGAVAEESLDLADVLASPKELGSFDWLSALGDFHEWPVAWCQRLEPVLAEIKPANPDVVLTTLLRALFRFGSLETNSRRPLLLSGPPGSGKTVTVAKLATSHILAGKSVDVLTLDVESAGALDRLETLLAPLGLQPKPVGSPTAVGGVLANCSGDVILMDSPSTNSFAPFDLGSLSKLAFQADAELVPVLPAGLGYGDALETAQSYAALGAKTMVITKLDAVRRLGGVLAAAEAGLALTEAGIGPAVGDGLHTLSADGLARLLLLRYHSAVDEETR